MLARLSAFVVWAVVAATVGVLGAAPDRARSPQAPAHAVAVGEAAAARGDLARLFGADADRRRGRDAPKPSSRFHLLGVIAPKPGTAGTSRAWR